MSTPDLKKVYPLIMKGFKEYDPIPENANIIEKVNDMIVYLNSVGRLSSDVVYDWNNVMQWSMGEGLKEATSEKVDKLIIDNKIPELINPFVEKITEVAQEQIELIENNMVAKQADLDSVTVQLANTANVVTNKADKAEIVSLESEISLLNSQKANKEYVDQQVQISNNAWQGSYETLSSLQTAFPTGNNNKYAVVADGFIYAYASGAWTNTNIVAVGINIPDKSITDSKIATTSNIVMKKNAKNLLDMSKVTPGYYVNYQNGNLVALAGYSALKTEIKGGEIYTLSNHTTATAKPLEQLAFLNENGVYISGLSNSGTSKSVTFTTPTNARFILVSLRDIYLNVYQLELGSTMTEYESYKVEISKEDLPKTLVDKIYQTPTYNFIKVAKDGSGDFTTIRKALESINNASENNLFFINLYEGTYKLTDEYTVAEISASSFIGILFNPYVFLVGIGDVDKIIIEATLDTTTFDGVTRGRVSTIAKKGDGAITNVTVKGTNLRYAVHDDYNYLNMKRKVKGCKFYKYGSGLEQAYGGGVWSGSEFEFENCYFYTDGTGVPFSFHNNIGFTRPSLLRLINCDFENKAGLRSIRFGSMGSGQKDVIEIIGSRSKGQIRLFEEQSNGVGIDFNLKGYGNDVVPVEIIHTHPTQQVTFDLVGQTKKMYNGHTATITKGTLVRLNSFGSAVMPLGTSDSTVFFYGIAMEDIATGASGFIRIGGYLPISETSLTGLVLGDKIGIVNGALIKVTTGDYIGYVEVNNYIRMINR